MFSRTLRYGLAAALALAVLTSTSTSWADPTYRYVRKDIGNDAWDGADSVNSAAGVGPWKSTSKANASCPVPNTANSDVVLTVFGGGYQSDAVLSPPITPLNGKRLFIRGRPLNTGAVFLRGGTVSTPWTSFSGVTFDGSLVIATAAERDTVISCVIRADLNVNASYSWVVNSTVSGGWRIGAQPDGRVASAGINGCTITSSGNKCAGGFGLGKGQDGHGACRTDSCTFSFNTYSNTSTAPSGEYVGMRGHYSRYMKIRGNHIFIDGTGVAASGVPGAFVWRDSSAFASFDCDTIIFYGSNYFWEFNSPGGYERNQVCGHTLDSCYIAIPGGIVYAADAIGDVFSYTTIVSGTYCIWTQYALGGGWTMNHCALLGTANPALLRADVASSGFVNKNAAGIARGDSAVLIKNTIFATWDPAGAGACGNPKKSGVLWVATGTDSLARHVKTYANLYAVFPYVAAGGDKSISYVSGGGYNCSKPGAGEDFEVLMESKFGPAVGDSGSVWGSAQFNFGGPDTLYVPNRSTAMDLRIGPSSKAKGVGTGGSDIGPVAYAIGPVLSYTTSPPITFANVRAGDVRAASLVISNTGSDSLIVTVVACVDVNGTAVSDLTIDPAVNVRLDVGESQSFTVTYTAPAAGNVPEAPRQIRFTSNSALYQGISYPVYVNPGAGGGGLDPTVVE